MIDFYEYFEGLQEGWDGPALLVFSDGTRVMARLDRNGLRPARYWLTEDDMVYVASEVSRLPLSAACVAALSSYIKRGMRGICRRDIDTVHIERGACIYIYLKTR